MVMTVILCVLIIIFFVALVGVLRSPDFIKRAWNFVAVSLDTLGDFGRFATATLAAPFGANKMQGLRELMRQMYEMGTLSIPVVMITGGFIGAVLAVEAYPQFEAIGLAGRLGSVIIVSVVKQIGPVLTAVMLAGRVGGAMTAELGTMRVTEQIDALRAMASDPVRTVAAPRVYACIIMMPVLTIFSDFVGAVGGWFVAVHILGVPNHSFLLYASQGVDNYTICVGLIKSVFFGVAIACIGCYKGFNCGSGAKGVGQACTESFVASFITILVMNFFLAVMLNDIYHLLWPMSASML